MNFDKSFIPVWIILAMLVSMTVYEQVKVKQVCDFTFHGIYICADS